MKRVLAQTPGANHIIYLYYYRIILICDEESTHVSAMGLA